MSRKRSLVVASPDRSAARWDIAGARLRRLDPDAYAQVVAATEAFLAVHERQGESDAEFMLRLRQIEGRRGGAN